MRTEKNISNRRVAPNILNSEIIRGQELLSRIITCVCKYLIYIYISKRAFWAGKVWEEAVTIDSECPAASRHDLIAVELCHLLGQGIFFTNFSGVSAKKGHVPYLFWTSVLCLVVQSTKKEVCWPLVCRIPMRRPHVGALGTYVEDQSVNLGSISF